MQKDLISRRELFNKLATVQAETANEMKGKIYAVIQEMETKGGDKDVSKQMGI